MPVDILGGGVGGDHIRLPVPRFELLVDCTDREAKYSPGQSGGGPLLVAGTTRNLVADTSCRDGAQSARTKEHIDVV